MKISDVKMNKFSVQLSIKQDYVANGFEIKYMQYFGENLEWGYVESGNGLGVLFKNDYEVTPYVMLSLVGWNGNEGVHVRLE